MSAKSRKFVVVKHAVRCDVSREWYKVRLLCHVRPVNLRHWIRQYCHKQNHSENGKKIPLVFSVGYYQERIYLGQVSCDVTNREKEEFTARSG